MRALVVALVVVSADLLFGGEEPAKPTPKELIEQMVRPPGGDSASGAIPVVSLFAEFSGEKATPAKRLLELRLEAVPALIDALGDERHTWVVSHPREPWDPPVVLHLGEVAAIILQSIAGRSFRPLPKPGEAVVPEVPFDFGKGARPLAVAWWTAVKEKGEAEILSEEVRAADIDVVQRAGQLVSLYPEQALAPLADARKKIAGQHADLERKVLVRLIADLPGDGPVAVLGEEMKGAPHLVQRVTAAFGLRRRGVPGTFEAMVEEWKQLDDYGSLPICALNPMAINYAIHQLVVFLVTAGRPEGIWALGEGLDARPDRVRALVVRALGRGPVTFNLYDYFRPWESVDPENPVDPVAAEAILRARLVDTASDDRYFGERKGEDWRICDLAARALAERFPDRYAFDITRPVSDRDARLTAIRATSPASKE